MEESGDGTVPIECFEARNQTMCKWCGLCIYWIYFGKKDYRAYEIETRKPHPRCFEKSNYRQYRYKK